MMRYLALLLFLTLFLSACENVRHKVGISAKPFATDGKFEDSAKINYTIIFGRCVPKRTMINFPYDIQLTIMFIFITLYLVMEIIF